MIGRYKQTRSEMEVFELAKEAAAEYGLEVRTEQKMKDIIDKRILPPNLSQPDRDSYKQARFDVVIFDAAGKALFAIEFDGPDHLRPKNQEADFRKGLFCLMAGLPLLRLGYEWYDEFERDAVVQFIIHRHVAWNESKDALYTDFQDRIDKLHDRGQTIDEIIREIEGEDPETWFHYQNAFPAINAIRTQLFNDFNLYPDFLNSVEDPFLSTYKPVGGFSPEFNREAIPITPNFAADIHEKAENEFESILDGRATCSVIYRVDGVLEKDGIHSDYSKTFQDNAVSIKWVYRSFDIPRRANVPAEYDRSFWLGIPGLQVYHLSEMLSVYKALKAILNEAADLKIQGFDFVNTGTKRVTEFFSGQKNDTLHIE